MVIVFFFQAEAGMRNSSVTGVQTCALPISGRSPLARIARRKQGAPLAAMAVERSALFPPCDPGERAATGALSQAVVTGVGHRSEERRVGEEGRSRWSPYH